MEADSQEKIIWMKPVLVGAGKGAKNVAQSEEALVSVSRKGREVSAEERSSLFLPMNRQPVLEHTRKRLVTITDTFRTSRSLERSGEYAATLHENSL